MKRFALLLTLLLLSGSAFSQNVRSVASYGEFCDSLDAYLTRITTVRSKVKINRILSRGKTLDFYFSQDFSDYPWHSGTASFVRSFLSSKVKEFNPDYSLGEISLFHHHSRTESLQASSQKKSSGEKVAAPKKWNWLWDKTC